MKEEEYIEFQFVESTLKKFGFKLIEILVRDIVDKNLISNSKRVGAHLKDSISFEVKRAGHMGGELLFYFPDYGRFIEIQYFKRTPNSKLAFRNSYNTSLISIKHNRPGMSRRRDTRWYSRNVYGQINELCGQLMYGFTEAMRQNLISQLITPFK